jgi:sulfate adenylyltransferase
MHVNDIWQPDKQEEAQLVYGTRDVNHPGVDYLINKSHGFYVGGELRGVESPIHYDFKALRDTPAEVRARFKKRGCRASSAFIPVM